MRIWTLFGLTFDNSLDLHTISTCKFIIIGMLLITQEYIMLSCCLQATSTLFTHTLATKGELELMLMSSLPFLGKKVTQERRS